ncbi:MULTISPECIES: zinc-binding dehydrogenase [unclassified Sphingomonas]|uniref:zinc-binding dehydrogenase n=1 Tax=unclassified Sphingomonas TaxID=196159 RepID=UPI0006F64925|nr:MULTISPECIES: zinc-binding dehydrogenase [unclassified Sphingomonas]KQX21666.1 NADH oxidase [Sphingomonas sp. Root1294]KQY72982.1 NADH oxidase [Sphingomonas sp. Root50]KRB88222.1 NADH oxidase [Sphingomonas sp. Root720]
MATTGRELRSTVGRDGVLTLSIEEVDVGTPAADEVIVRVEAAPINPSDLGLMVGPAQVASLRASGTAERPVLSFDVPKAALAGVEARIGEALPVGIEGAGTVVAAGADAKALEGKRVGAFGGGMYADYRRLKAKDVLPLPEGASAADGASMFVNPLTALGFVETALGEGHKAIVHTAAASNLGQMLQKICLRDGIPLVNIVRSEQQADILRAIGATHVLDSRDGAFRDRLVDAIAATGATVAFDAIGGGTLGGDIVRAMEQAAVRTMAEYSRYGSNTFKQLYIYGALDLSPTVLNRMAYGFQWSVSGWLLMPFLAKAGPEVLARMHQRVANELTSTFASHYTRTIGLAEALDPDTLRAYERKATGEKYLIDPTRG